MVKRYALKRSMKKKVTCIIPAYNEENRISKVLEVVRGHPLINEIIVVNDCSKDNTLKVIKKFRDIKILNNKKNLGKTLSVLEGLKVSKNDLVLLLDADLLNLTKDNISRLILAVLNNKVDVPIALFGTMFAFRIIGADSGSGQRVFNKKIVDFKKIAGLEKYGFESYMNKEIIEQEYSVKIVDWKNAGCTTKGEKENKLFPVRAYVSMWLQMIRTTGFFGFLLQSFQLARLSSKNK